jgi:hypothetical protein
MCASVPVIVGIQSRKTDLHLKKKNIVVKSVCVRVCA